MDLKLLSIVTKGLKIKVRKFLETILTFQEVAMEVELKKKKNVVQFAIEVALKYPLDIPVYL